MRLGVAALLMAAVALAATVTEEVGGFAPPEPPPAQPRVPAAYPSAGAESAPDHTPEWVATILARPLFSPDRRPAAEAAAAGGRALQGLPRLSGIVVGAFGRSAIFVPDGRKPLVVAEGGRVDAWTVQRIETGTVRVSGPGGIRSVQPTFQGPPPIGQRNALSPQR